MAVWGAFLAVWETLTGAFMADVGGFLADWGALAIICETWGGQGGNTVQILYYRMQKRFQE